MLQLLLVRVAHIDERGCLLHVPGPQRLQLNLQRLREVVQGAIKLALELQHAADVIQAARHVAAAREVGELVQADVERGDVVSEGLPCVVAVGHDDADAVAGGCNVAAAGAEVFFLDDESLGMEFQRFVLDAHDVVRAADVAVALRNVQAARAQKLRRQLSHLVVPAPRPKYKQKAAEI